MRVLFRTDASTIIGTGHIARCIALAQELRAQGATCEFTTRAHSGNQIQVLRSRGFHANVLQVSTAARSAKEDDHQSWLGTDSSSDAIETRRAMSGDYDWLVVDHYALDREWESQFRDRVPNCLVIDDLANRPHECNLLLDQNYSLRGTSRYLGLVPDDCTTLLGPKFALLGKEYRDTHVQSVEAGRVRHRVLIYFGGTDTHNLTTMTLKALRQTPLRGAPTVVIIGPNNPHGVDIKKASIGFQIEHIGSVNSLAEVLATCSLALGAGGTTTWERLAFRVPSIVVSVAENQIDNAEALHRMGLISYIGHWDSITVNAIAQEIQRHSRRPEKEIASALSSSNIDGLGARRVVSKMHGERRTADSQRV